MSRKATLDTCKNVEGVTRKLQTCLNIDLDHITQADIDKILNLQVPTEEVDNLIKITNHTNESLEQLKTSLKKNRNVMAEEISCLNECLVDTSSEPEFDSSNYTEEDIYSEGTSPVRDNSNTEIKNADDEELRNEIMSDEEELRKENMSEEEYLTRKLLLESKKQRKEVLGTPPPVFKIN